MVSALVDVGCERRGYLGRSDDVSAAAEGVDAVLIATPDAAVAEVAAAIRPVPDTVVLHMAGSLGLDALAPHRRRGSLHPLVPLPSPEVGRVRLRSGITFAVAGDDLAAVLGRSLGGRCIEIDDDRRAAYHAAACIAANHLVALLGQVERVAATVGLEVDDFLGLAAAALGDVADLGPAAALTGPASRGDLLTLACHRRALAPDERDGYDAGVALVHRLAMTTEGDGEAGSAGVRRTEMAPCA